MTQAIAESHQSQVVTQNQVHQLKSAMLAMPQAPGMETTHHFAGGMYCRRIEIPAGTLIVSKVHKTEHLFIGCIGELRVAGQGETYILRPGDVVPSPIGTERAVLALSDVVCMTIHKTDRTAADEGLEADLMEHDPLSQYDVNNQPKQGALVTGPSAKGLEN